jgi:hypothetical protein
MIEFTLKVIKFNENFKVHEKFFEQLFFCQSKENAKKLKSLKFTHENFLFVSYQRP